MSEISRVRRDQQDEIAELQTEHSRRRKRLQQQHKEEINNLRENFDQQKEGAREEGAAAVNHIREKSQETLKLAQENRKKAQEKSTNELNRIEALYRKRVQEMQQNRQAIIEDQDTRTSAKIATLKEKNQARVDQLRNEQERSYIDAKTRSQQAISELKQNHERRIHDIAHQNEVTQNHERERGRLQYERIRTENKENVDNLTLQGEKVIEDTKKSHENKMTQLEKEQQREFERKKNDWIHREKRTHEDFTRRISDAKEAYAGQMKTQRKRFNSLYDQNEQANRRALQIQRDLAAKELNQLKSEFMRAADKYAGKTEDPFYKVQDRGSAMRETAYNYVIEAYLPEHEKDAVRVVVNKDKAVVQGQRAFSDKFEQDDGKRVTSSSYQTFREEFPFDKPIIKEGMTRSRNGDWVQIVIPKLHTFSKKA